MLVADTIEVEPIRVTPGLDRFAGDGITDCKRIGHHLRPETEAIEPQAVGASQDGPIERLAAINANDVSAGRHAHASHCRATGGVRG